jgi:hypothetical protein
VSDSCATQRPRNCVRGLLNAATRRTPHRTRESPKLTDRRQLELPTGKVVDPGQFTLYEHLKIEFAAVKQDVRSYCTVEELKTRHPDFSLWSILSDPEIKELADGQPFTPKAYAENLTLRKFGCTSRETLKKDRRKLRAEKRPVSRPEPK